MPRSDARPFSQAKAKWLRRGLLAWPPGDDPAQHSWRLHWSDDAQLGTDPHAIHDGESVALSVDPAGIPATLLATNPHLARYTALRLDRSTARRAEDLLLGQLRVGRYDAGGRLVEASGVQIPGVLDDLYAARAARRELGVTWSTRGPALTVWAPTARAMTLLLWPAGADPTDEHAAQRFPMQRSADGCWSVRGRRDWAGAAYRYEVVAYVPWRGHIVTSQVTDPYSVGLTVDSTHSVLVDLTDPALAPRAWRDHRPVALSRRVDETIYELHVRDFSISDETCPAELRGSYLAFAADTAGTRHLRRLAEAGLNTVHLLPVFDIATIPEDPARQFHLRADLRRFPPDSEHQQAHIVANADTDAFNWGYDPWHFLTPEGSYASTARAAHGATRTREMRAMVGALHGLGLRVVLDQVYNHTNASGDDPHSVLDRIVPGYYHRLDDLGAVEQSTCCSNVATEHVMAGKLMVDAVVLWAKYYKIDGFRFDLMGHHTADNLHAVRRALDALTMRRDGVDGKSVTLYGEGWNFGEVANNTRFVQAAQGQLGATGIATFNDRLRDAVRGGRPFDADPRLQGFGTGLFTQPNASRANGTAEEQAHKLRNATELVALGLVGNLRGYHLECGHGPVPGELIDYCGMRAGYSDEPDDAIAYVDAHDNETLFDALTLKLAPDVSMADRVRMNTLCLATVALSQSPMLWHAGTDILRSKSLDRDSFNSGDWFNLLDWSLTENGFGRGLPPKPANHQAWRHQRPLLADPSLKPGPDDIAQAHAMALDLLRLRFSTRLFRLGSARRIVQKVHFPVAGTLDAQLGVLAMHIDDSRGTRFSRHHGGVLVVFNVTPNQVAQPLPSLVGQQFALSPVQAEGADPVVKHATWDAREAVASVPARTVAVFMH